MSSPSLPRGFSPRDSLRLRRWHGLIPGLALYFLCCLVFLPAWAQDEPGIDDAAIERLRQEVAADDQLDETARAELNADLDAAKGALAEAEELRAAQAELRGLIEGQEAQVEDYRRRMRDIERAPQTVTRRLGADPDLDAIESEITFIETQRDRWIAERKSALDAMALAANGNTAMRDQMAELAAEQEALEDAATGARENLSGEVAAALAAARAAANREELQRLQTELRSAPALSAIRTAKVAWLDAAIAEADALLQELAAVAAGKRQSAAAARGAETRRLLDGLSEVPPELQALAEENLALAEEAQDLATRIADVRQQLAATRETRERIEQDAALTRRRLEVAGLEAALGDVMLERLSSLPDVRRLNARVDQRNQRISDLSLAAIDTEQMLRERSDRAAYFSAVLGDRSDWSRQEERVAEQLYDQQRELLTENLQARNSLLRLLVDGNQAGEELLAIEDYSDFLTGNLLWTRNYSYLKPEHLQNQLRLLVGAVQPRSLEESAAAWSADPVLIILVLVLVVVLARRRRLRNALRERLSKPISPSEERSALLLSTLALSAVTTLPLPLFLAVLGRGLAVAYPDMEAMHAIGAALEASAVVLYVINFLLRLANRHGAGRRLLKWNSGKADALTRDLPWLKPALVVASAAITLGRNLTPTDSGGPLAAAGSFALAAMILFVALRTLRSGQYHSDAIAKFVLRATVLLAGAIVVMHLSGQLFAAHVYLRACVVSIAAVLGTLLVLNVVQRMLVLYRAKLLREAREARRLREIEHEGEDETTEEEDDSLEALSSLSQAHTQLLSLARLVALGSLLWLIWSPALPALSVLDSITLWTSVDTSLPAGELRPITLSVVLLAVVTLIVTALLTKHLPPLINVLLLEWTKVSAGGRYATGMLMQYLIIGVGAGTSLGMLGFEWSKVQWLVAALGVGIGFGLQEIVANFISGLIVLFERPIRVGDIINAGGHDGVVRNINPRATVVETFEGKEVMIPNKELITNVVTNWSLSNPKLRLVIPVGIAYGSDVKLAMRLLLEVAQNNPEIVDDPEPFVTFEDFGDNALLMWLRCFAVRNYPKVSSQLRVEIYDAFEAAEISISFPQRDVHLDAADPIPIRMVREPTEN